MAERFILKNHSLFNGEYEYVIFDEAMQPVRKRELTPDAARALIKTDNLICVSPMQAYNEETRKRFLERLASEKST